MTMFTNRRPTNRAAMDTPALIADPPLAELREWWLSVKKNFNTQFINIQNNSETFRSEVETLIIGIDANRIKVQGFAPTSPRINDLWLDTSDQNKYKFWDGVAWVYKQDLVLAALVSTESSVRATADGFLSGKYTLTVAAGNVVTGMNITSSTGAGTDISDVTFVATNFKIYNGVTGITMFNVSGSNVNLANTLTVSTSGKVFTGVGTYANNNTPFYVDSTQFSLGAGLTWAASVLTINGSGTFSGSITASSGTIGGFSIGATTLSAGSGTSFIELISNIASIGMQLGTAATTMMQLARTGIGFSYLGDGTVGLSGLDPVSTSFSGYLELLDSASPGVVRVELRAINGTANFSDSSGNVGVNINGTTGFVDVLSDYRVLGNPGLAGSIFDSVSGNTYNFTGGILTSIT